MTDKEYIQKWTLNAKKHYEDEDYQWLCNQMPQFNRVLEFGCGAGYSTLAFAENNHSILSVDSTGVAIDATAELLVQKGISAKTAEDTIDFQKSNIWLWEYDLARNPNSVVPVVNNCGIELIVLCNPGGNYKQELLSVEANILLNYGFTDNEIQHRCYQENYQLLHKFVMIYAGAHIAINSGIPYMLVDRGTEEQVEQTLEQIEKDTGMRRFFKGKRKIGAAPDGGVVLGDEYGLTDANLVWGMGIYRCID